MFSLANVENYDSELGVENTLVCPIKAFWELVFQSRSNLISGKELSKNTN